MPFSMFINLITFITLIDEDFMSKKHINFPTDCKWGVSGIEITKSKGLNIDLLANKRLVRPPSVLHPIAKPVVVL